MATYGGAAIFGRSVAVLMTPNPSEAQINTYFGVQGRFRLHGGSRGRSFVVSGLLAGSTPADLCAARDTILSYDDGIGRVLVDSEGSAWPAVVFTGAFEFVGPYGVGHGGWLRPYRAIFDGMI